MSMMEAVHLSEATTLYMLPEGSHVHCPEGVCKKIERESKVLPHDLIKLPS